MESIVKGGVQNAKPGSVICKMQKMTEFVSLGHTGYAKTFYPSVLLMARLLLNDQRNGHWSDRNQHIGTIINKEEKAMTNKLKVKVIKKDEIREPAKKVISESRSKRVAAREMVSNVTSWVSDFQTRKRDETKVAFEKLFNNTPQPSEM